MEITKNTIKALSSDTRLEMLKILAKRRRIAADLAKDLDLAPSTVNEHLKKLEESGLVKKKDSGHKWFYYEITDKGKNLVKPKNPMQFVIILSLGFLTMIIAGLKSLPWRAAGAAQEATLTVARKSTETTTTGGQAIPWGNIAFFIIGLVLVLIGIWNIFKKT